MLKLNKAQADWAQEAASSKLRSGRPLKLKLLLPSWQSAKLLVQLQKASPKLESAQATEAALLKLQAAC